jgi:tRNA dimethylallyltransferase
MANKTCIIITGPTASGKTALAIQTALHFNTAIISADSRQCFQELSIAVAKPSAAELAAVPHYFINSHSIHDEVNTAVFEQYALQTIHDLFQQHNMVVMTGGTGLYIKAFCQGIDAIPPIPAEIKEQVALQYAQNGLVWLQQQVQQLDPLYWNNGEIHNPHRLLRALEVILTTGQSIRNFQQGVTQQRDFNIVQVGLQWPRDVLYQRINQRVLHMMQAGLPAEAEALFPLRHLKALQTVGYAEWFGYMLGQYSQSHAVELIQQNTRRYAKRQFTWFNRDTSVKWLISHTLEAVLEVAGM